MANEATIGGSGQLFVGEDKTFVLELLDSSDAPVNMTGWTIIFVVSARDAGTPLFNITASVTGSFNASRVLNSQRASAALTSAQMDTLKAKTYRHSWKRTDSGVETILAYGDFEVEKATAP